MEGSGSTLDSIFGFGKDLLKTTSDYARSYADASIRARFTRQPDPTVSDARAQAVAIPAASAPALTTPSPAPVAGVVESFAQYVPMFLAVALGVLIVGLALKKAG